MRNFKTDKKRREFKLNKFLIKIENHFYKLYDQNIKSKKQLYQKILKIKLNDINDGNYKEYRRLKAKIN